jgi:hypothetical protein
MSPPDEVIKLILSAFGDNQYPGDQYLQGSAEGCEPFEEVGPFKGLVKWQAIEGDFLDARADALSFFSQAGFRFFLPAYLIADLQGRLRRAEPLFHLTHGYQDIEVQVPTRTRTFLIKSGKSGLVNPRRYGAMTFCDYARHRLSVFTREEAGAIVAYLKYRREAGDATHLDKEAIDAALNAFWLERARTAPTAQDLKDYLREQEEYLAAVREDQRK